MRYKMIGYTLMIHLDEYIRFKVDYYTYSLHKMNQKKVQFLVYGALYSFEC